MANTAAAAKKSASQTKNAASGGLGAFLKAWASRNRYYIIAFFIPVVVMYISYAIFGLYPFGERSVLALDFNAQYVYYFESLRDDFWSFDRSAFYDWSRNLSGGFMGVIGYYLASPFTLIVMLLPRNMILTSLLIMILCKIGSASVTMNLYLQKSKGLSPMQATIFGVLFSMCAYMVIQTIDPMWLDGLVLLPLVALGVERLVDGGKKVGYIIPLAIMFVANFYIGYMIGIFTAFYFLYYLFFGKDGSRGKFSDYVYTCITFGVSTIVAVMCAAFMILPVYNALQLGKFDFTTPDYSFKLQFEPIRVLAQLLVAQYDSVNVQGSPEIYCGILTVVMLPVYFLNSKISVRNKLGYTFLLAVMFFSMYIKPVDMMWHGGQMPNWLPFRYSFIVSFILVSMAAAAFKNLDGIRPSALGGIFVGILVTVLYINTKEYESLDIMGSIWLSIGLAAAYSILVYTLTQKQSKLLVPIVMLVIISGELVYNNVKSMKSIHKEVAYSTRASYEVFMESGRAAVKLMEQHDSGLYRSEKTFTRCINDNDGWGLKGLTHSSSVMNAKILSFIETLGYSSRSYYSRYDGTTELGDSLLGIKYVIDRGNTGGRQLLHKAYGLVDTYTYKDRDDKDGEGNPREKTLSIYENPNALSIGYMVDDDLLRIDHLGNDNPFNSQNVLLSTMLGQTTFDEVGAISGVTNYYTRIDVGEPVLGAITLDSYNGQACYRRQETGDPTVDWIFKVDSDKEVFAFFKTENEQAVNLWLASRTDPNEEFDGHFTGYGQYFETQNYCIISLGSYAPGTEVCLRMTVLEKDNATIIKEPFFYYFDRDQFVNDIAKLKERQLQIEKYTDTYIKGTVDAGEGQILFTSLPSEPGWTVKVDGKKVETTECLKAMLYVPLAAGTHTVTFSYTPPGFVTGVILLIIGIIMIVLFWFHENDRMDDLKALLSGKKPAKKKAAPKKASPKKDAPKAEAPAEDAPEEETAEEAEAEEAAAEAPAALPSEDDE